MASDSRLQDLSSALLLAGSGGMLDAIVYLDHGHVFANAMTGNVILLGIAAAGHDWGQIPPHVAPILAFLLGIAGARFLQVVPARHGSLMALGLEIVGLFGAGLLPASTPQLAFTASVAFVSAFQVATFRRVGRFTYNSTFITGNLRDVVEGLFDSIAHRDREQSLAGRAKFAKLGLICLSFCAGAVVGAFAAGRFPAHAIWFAEPPLLAVLIMVIARPEA